MDQNYLNMGWGWAMGIQNALEKDPKQLYHDGQNYLNFGGGRASTYNAPEKDHKNEIIMDYTVTT